MKIFTKHMLAGLLVGSVALVGAVTADDHVTDVRHKVIKINADTQNDVKIMVDEAGSSDVVVFKLDELNDQAVIDEKLAHLDEQTRETVLNALQGVKHIGSANFDHTGLLGDIKKKVMVLHKGEGHVAMAHADADVDFEFEVSDEDGGKTYRKHIILGDEHHVLKGHTSAIVRMIEKGEFSQDELDEIQAALDAKR